MKIFLFDIDGTLISPGPVPRRAINAALENYLGVAPDLQIKDVAGLTDRLIVSNTLIKCGKKADDDVINSIVDHYLEIIGNDYLKEDGAFVYNDAVQLVDKIKKNKYPCGLLTGNMEKGANIKLGKFDLMKYFEFGAFAEDGTARNDLPQAAKNKAETLYKIEIDYNDMVLVGDTPEDAIAAKNNGCRSIIVCRRAEWYGEIVSIGADLIVNDLLDKQIDKLFLT